MQPEDRMGAERDLFSMAAGADRTELKAHAALYAAREASTVQPAAAAAVEVTPRPRPVPQGGAAVARRMREQLVAERAQLLAVSRNGRAVTDRSIPSAAILRFRLSDLPRLTRPTPRPRPEGTDGGPSGPGEPRS
ncbi:MAG: hypothetical protein ACK4M0_01130 [Phreatobacter sp.]